MGCSLIYTNLASGLTSWHFPDFAEQCMAANCRYARYKPLKRVLAPIVFGEKDEVSSDFACMIARPFYNYCIQQH